jgi:hypothetical protein
MIDSEKNPITGLIQEENKIDHGSIEPGCRVQGLPFAGPLRHRHLLVQAASLYLNLCSNKVRVTQHVILMYESI